jgi:hypothetical protein
MKKILQKLSLGAGSALTMAQLAAGAVLAATTTTTTTTGKGVNGGDITVDGSGYATNVGTVISSVLSFVMVLAALLVLMYLVWGGIEWITSGGDKGKTESARNRITAAVIGLIVLAAAYAIFNLVISFVGLNPEALWDTIKPIDTK